MRSIRLSLVLCILVLLVLSLVTVSGLAYREALISLDAKKAAMHDFLTAKYQEQRRQEIADLDRSLQHDARAIAHAVTLKFEIPDLRSLYLLGAMSTPAIPQGHLQVPVWCSEAVFP